MRRSFLLFSAGLIFAAGVVAACKQKVVAATGDDDDAGETTPNTGEADDSGTEGVPAAPSNGIPCDVEAVIENRCAVCHGTVAPQGPPLLTYDDFAAKSTADPNKTRGQLAAEYMKAKTMPKLPAVAEDDEIATVDTWVTGGMAKSTEACIRVDNDASAPDGGAQVDGGSDGGTVCTSNAHWTDGDNGNALMHPGADCLGCHAQNGGPAFLFAGTVYPTLHEPIDCNGAPPPITVTVTDKNKRKVDIATNAAGNFSILAKDQRVRGFRPPFSVTVTAPNKAPRSMTRTITGGDCNSCHTQAGGDGGVGLAPPGRILAPVAP